MNSSSIAFRLGMGFASVILLALVPLAAALAGLAAWGIALAAVVAIAVGAAIAWSAVRSITRPLNRALLAAQNLAAGKLDGAPARYMAADELGQLQKAQEAMRDMLKTVIAEIGRMSREHDAGDIDVVIDTSRFEGELRTMAHGVNQMVAGHIAVKKKAMACVAEFGRGNFAAQLEIFPGKKAFINEIVEQVRGNLVGLIAEMNRMSAEHDKGDIDVVIDAARFDGDFRTMAHGINQMVAGHIAVKKKAMACVAEFGQGNFDAPLESFPGKKSFINDTIE